LTSGLNPSKVGVGVCCHCNLCFVSLNRTPLLIHRPGDSYAVLFNATATPDPTSEEHIWMNKWNASFTQYPRCAKSGKSYMNGTQSRCASVHKEDFKYMGYSIRTDTWRYTVRALMLSIHVDLSCCQYTWTSCCQHTWTPCTSRTILDPSGLLREKMGLFSSTLVLIHACSHPRLFSSTLVPHSSLRYMALLMT
jgi:hypothetical protein